MLEDRFYMRGKEPRLRMPFTILLMILVTIAFAFQQINQVYLGWNIYPYLALGVEGLRQGWVWQLITFQFLHAGLWHLFCNLILIWFFGRIVEERIGKWQCVLVYFGSGIIGGLLHSLLTFSFPGHFGSFVVGASAGASGLLAAAIVLEPEQEILVCFVLPVRAKYLLIISMAVALFFTIVPSDPLVAHAAHLGGLLAGVAYIRWGLYAKMLRWNWHPFHARQRRRELVRTAVFKSSLWKQRRKADDDNLAPEEFISREVDPILDKISAHGIQSLTPRERQILEAARAKMEKR